VLTLNPGLGLLDAEGSSEGGTSARRSEHVSEISQTEIEESRERGRTERSADDSDEFFLTRILK
jgi:hypothetical protein